MFQRMNKQGLPSPAQVAMQENTVVTHGNLNAKKKPSAEDKKFGEVMHKWKQGKLHTGRGKKGGKKGPIVPYPEGRDQAEAIARSESKKHKKKACGR